MNSFRPEVLDNLKISQEVIANIREIGEGKGKQELFADKSPEILENLRQMAIIESTESSNRLEGVTIPRTVLEKIVRYDKEPFIGSRSEGEIAGYKNVLQMIHERHEFIDLTNNVILQFHRDLFRFVAGAAAGDWKKTDNSITEKRADGTIFVRFQPTPAWRTPEAMAALHKAYIEASESEVDALILVGLYILDFLCIHPFSDGNGRMVRLLTVLLLYREEYDVGRYISIERIIEKTKITYYDTLFRSSQGWHEGRHDPMPWLSYFLAVIRAAYSELSERVGDFKETRGVKTQLVLQAIDNYIGEFSMSELHLRCPTVGWDMLRHVIRNERDRGHLEAIGRGRGARWKKVGKGNP